MRITSLHIRARDHDDDRKTTRETAGGAQGGSWCEKEGLTRKLVRSRLMWAGHVERTEGERLVKRMEGRRRRGGPKLGWEDYDLAGVGGEGRMRPRMGGGSGDGWWRRQ